MNSIVTQIRCRCLTDVTVAQLIERHTFPVEALATVLRQLNRRHPCGDTGKQTTRTDLGKLSR